MILNDTILFLKSACREPFENLVITDLRIGLYLTAVKLSDGSCGVAGTVQDTQVHCAKKERDYGEFTPSKIRGRRIIDLFETEKRSGAIDSLRIAVLNAISSSLIRNGNYRIIEDADPVDLLDLSPVKTITIVGAFHSYIRRISGTGNRLHVLELDEKMLADEHKKYFVPSGEFGRVIPGSDIVIITGLTLVNNTIDALLASVSPGAQVIVTGPSSSLAPDILFRNKVSIAGATLITDPDMLFEIAGEAGAGFHLFRYCARKICMINPSLPKVTIITSMVEAGTVETMMVTPEMELLGNEELMNADLVFHETDKICITSEYSLSTVTGRLDPARKRAVELLKDKHLFRQILKETFPEHTFRFVKVGEIGELVITRKSVIKPVRGIFGTAVRIIGPETDMTALAMELREEIRKNAKVYPDSVLASGDFLVEDFIEGEEYAVDMFYDSVGNPCIVNIMHHPLPANGAYLHMMYNSSKKAFDEMYDQSKSFFRELNKILKVTNFVMHTELRLHNGEIFPIEINSMRFGGMGLCNLVHYSHGINPFLCYLHDREPDWENAWNGKEGSVYTFFIAYNGAGKNVAQHRPLPEKLKGKFSRVIREQPFDHLEQLAFGVYFLEETHESIPELLKTEFDEFFEPL